MTEPFEFSNEDFVASQLREREMEAALGDIEQALMRFEKILMRHLPAVNTISRASGRKTLLKTSVANGLSNVVDILSRPSADFGTVFNPTTSKTNRFPASGGQFLTDLWSSLSRFSGRNL